MKRKLTIYIFLIAALSVVISSAVGVWSFHQREVEDARQTLTELLSLMDAEGGTTDVSRPAEAVFPGCPGQAADSHRP